MGLVLFVGVLGLLLLGLLKFYQAVNQWLRKHLHWTALYAWRLVVSGFGWLAWELYGAVWPRDVFYRHEFERIVNTSLPASVVFQAKDATYPDQHGDYQAYAVMTVPDTTYRRLIAVVKADTSWLPVTHPEIIDLVGWDVAALLPPARLVVQAGRDGGNVIICFGQDGHTIPFYRFSS